MITGLFIRRMLSERYYANTNDIEVVVYHPPLHALSSLQPFLKARGLETTIMPRQCRHSFTSGQHRCQSCSQPAPSTSQRKDTPLPAAQHYDLNRLYLFWVYSGASRRIIVLAIRKLKVQRLEFYTSQHTDIDAGHPCEEVRVL
jgi:hypothetical protein